MYYITQFYITYYIITYYILYYYTLHMYYQTYVTRSDNTPLIFLRIIPIFYVGLCIVYVGLAIADVPMDTGVCRVDVGYV